MGNFDLLTRQETLEFLEEYKESYFCDACQKCTDNCKEGFVEFVYTEPSDQDSVVSLMKKYLDNRIEELDNEQAISQDLAPNEPVFSELVKMRDTFFKKEK